MGGTGSKELSPAEGPAGSPPGPGPRTRTPTPSPPLLRSGVPPHGRQHHRDPRLRPGRASLRPGRHRLHRPTSIPPRSTLFNKPSSSANDDFGALSSCSGWTSRAWTSADRWPTTRRSAAGRSTRARTD
ncbi:hypothetical protein ACRAWF_27835 [Streptomyces sp. L7]